MLLGYAISQRMTTAWQELNKAVQFLQPEWELSKKRARQTAQHWTRLYATDFGRAYLRHGQRCTEMKQLGTMMSLDRQVGPSNSSFTVSHSLSGALRSSYSAIDCAAISYSACGASRVERFKADSKGTYTAHPSSSGKPSLGRTRMRHPILAQVPYQW